MESPRKRVSTRSFNAPPALQSHGWLVADSIDKVDSLVKTRFEEVPAI